MSPSQVQWNAESEQTDLPMVPFYCLSYSNLSWIRFCYFTSCLSFVPCKKNNVASNIYDTDRIHGILQDGSVCTFFAFFCPSPRSIGLSLSNFLQVICCRCLRLEWYYKQGKNAQSFHKIKRKLECIYRVFSFMWYANNCPNHELLLK